MALSVSCLYSLPFSETSVTICALTWASVTGLVEASLLFALCIEMYCYVMSVLNLETFVIELFVDAFVSVYV